MLNVLLASAMSLLPPQCDSSLHLEPGLLVASGLQGIPTAVALTKEHILAVAPRTGKLIDYPRSGGPPSTIHLDSPASALAAWQDSVWVIADDQMFVWDGRKTQAVALPLAPGTRLTSLAVSRRSILLTAVDSTHTRILVYDKGGGGPLFRDTLQLPAGVRAGLALDEVFGLYIVDARAAVRVYNPATGELKVTTPAVAAADIGFVTTAVLPLDCGRFLQFVADLRSDRRIVSVHSDTGTLRSADFQESLGLASVDIRHHEILAYHENAGQSGFVIYRWSWRARPAEPPRRRVP